MIFDDEVAFRISGKRPDWSADYSPERFDGPLQLTLTDQAICLQCKSSFDDLSEELVITDSSRVYRKGKGAIFTASGKMPIGSGISFKQTQRYSANAVKVVKDFFVPSRTLCQDRIALDTLTLSADFTHYRELLPDLSLTDWNDISETPTTWDSVPLAIVLKHPNGLELEIGTGNDLWRWAKGFLPEGNRSAFTLVKDEAGLHFKRDISIVKDETPIAARSYRFSWYMAWSTDASLPQSDEKTIPLTFRPNGDVALGSLNNALQESPGSTIVFDILDVPWTDRFLHTTGTHPCFASGQTIKKLKRIMRQLADFKGDNLKLHVKNILPGRCTAGNHVHSKSDRDHWDMASILDFAIWTRQCLGNEWVITNDSAALDLPALRDPFAVTDHEIPPVQYEYVPPEV